MALTLKDIVNRFEFWFRLGLFLHEVLRTALFNVLHNINADVLYKGLPTIPKDLYKELDQKHRNNFDKLYQKGIISRDQYLLIFPTSLQTDSSKFDVTLLVILIRNCLNIPPPLNGWNVKDPLIQDQSIAANSIRAREWRNFCHHTDPEDININIFTFKWNEGVNIVKALGYTVDVSALKIVCLDVSSLSILQSLMNFLNIQQKRLLKQVSDLQKEVDQHSTDIMDQLKPQIQIIQTDIDKLKQYSIKCLQNETDITQLNFNMDIGFTDVNMMKEEIQNINDKFTRLSKDVLSQFILPEVILLTCDLIGTRWYDLARMIDVDEDNINNIDKLAISTKKKMKNCFQIKKNEITWKKLKQDLTNLGGCDHIINKLKSATLLTTGIRDASLELKRIYIKELINILLSQPLKNNDEDCQTVPREEAYIELAILNAADIDNDWNTSDREFHMKNSHLERKSIKLDEILTCEDDFVIVRGIAGIGKSTMAETFVLKWAKSQLLTGENGSANVQFLFRLSCREINTMNHIKNSEELLKELFPSVFDKISVAELKDVADRVLVVVDGVDELKDIEMLNNKTTESRSSNLRSVQNLLDINWHLLSGHKTIALGRPRACKIIKDTFKKHCKCTIKSVEVCGFSTNNVLKYIDKYFKENTELAEAVKKKIDESENLNVMSTIPVYIWVICGLFNTDITIESPKTTTELCTYSCLIFIRNHLKTLKESIDLSNVSLMDLTEDKRIQNIIYCLAEMSLAMLTQNKVLFTEYEIQRFQTFIDLENTGFVCKSQQGERKAVYQFRHLVLQEYLASLSIYLSPSKSKRSLRTESLACCLPIVAGLYGIQEDNSNVYLRSFLHNLNLFVSQTQKKCLQWIPSTTHFDILNQICIRFQSSIHNGELTIDDKLSDALSAIFEYQGNLSTGLYKIISRNRISIGNIFHAHDIRNISFLIEKVQSLSITKISIENLNNKNIPDKMSHLLQMFWSRRYSTLPRCNILKIQRDNVMRIYSESTSASNTICFCLPPNDKSFQKHSKILMSLLTTEDVQCTLNVEHNMIHQKTFTLYQALTLLKAVSCTPTILVVSTDKYVQGVVFHMRLDGCGQYHMMVPDITPVEDDCLEHIIKHAFNVFQSIEISYDVPYIELRKLIHSVDATNKVSFKLPEDLREEKFIVTLSQARMLIDADIGFADELEVHLSSEGEVAPHVRASPQYMDGRRFLLHLFKDYLITEANDAPSPDGKCDLLEILELFHEIHIYSDGEFFKALKKSLCSLGFASKLKTVILSGDTKYYLGN